MATDITRPFDPETQAIYCSFDGLRCVDGGHLLGRFLMCPVHGEFTMAPTVMQERDGTWLIHFDSQQELSMWETCAHLSTLPPDSFRASTG